MNDEYVCPKCHARYLKYPNRADANYYNSYLLEYLIHLLEHLIEPKR